LPLLEVIAVLDSVKYSQLCEVDTAQNQGVLHSNDNRYLVTKERQKAPGLQGYYVYLHP
jgi:hypothetical protein